MKFYEYKKGTKKSYYRKQTTFTYILSSVP